MSPDEFRRELNKLGYFIIGTEPVTQTPLVDLVTNKSLGQVLTVGPDEENRPNHYLVTTNLGSFLAYVKRA